MNVAKKVSVARDGRLTNSLFYVVADGNGGVLMVPRPAMQKALDSHYAGIRFHDQQPSQNNLGRSGKPGFLPGSWHSDDEGAEGSTGSQGSAGGGAPRPAPRPDKRPALRAGAFTVSDEHEPLQPGGYGYLNHPVNATDQEEEDPDTGLGQVIASLEDPGDGMTYGLQRLPDGSVGIVLCEDTGADLNMNDAAYKHSLTADAKFMKRWAGILRRRGARTKDWAASNGTTIFRHKNLAEGERLALEGPDEFGGYDLVLYSPTKDLTGYPPTPPPGTGNKAKENNKGSMRGPAAFVAQPSTSFHGEEHDIHEIESPVRTGDRRLTEPQMLRSMNRANAQFWAR